MLNLKINRNLIKDFKIHKAIFFKSNHLLKLHFKGLHIFINNQICKLTNSKNKYNQLQILILISHNNQFSLLLKVKHNKINLK
jgi:hypothetical protein